jgi:hypothetical protein
MTVDGAQKVPIEGCLVAGRMHSVLNGQGGFTVPLQLS